MDSARAMASYSASALLTPDYMVGLNDAQRRAVEAIHGPVLVLAGAGTGKTRVLTTRIAHILLTEPVYPSHILAVTFTNKAANEMAERLRLLVERGTEGIWLGTFHALSLRILRRYADLVHLKSGFTILDTDDQTRLLKQLIKAENLNEKQWVPRLIATQISRYKDRGLLPQRLTGAEMAALPSLCRDTFIRLYTAYQQRLQVMNAVDFGDLILLCLELFREHPHVLEHYQNHFKFILVDEYQDTNVSQYLWLRLLAAGSQNICCVGDDDQSIYGWRGAEVTNILRFEKDFPGATVIKLEENYRSTHHILGAAAGLIAKNGERLGKTLWTSQAGGEKVKIHCLRDGQEEAYFIGTEIDTLHRNKEPLSSMAILVRASFQTREFEDRFITLGIPYRVVGGARFYERAEIRDALAYLRVIVSPDDSLAFERIINTPKRGIGESTLQTLHKYARNQGVSLARSCCTLFDTDELKGKVKSTLQTLLETFEGWRALKDHLSPSDLMKKVLEESGYFAMWKADKSPEAAGRIDNLKELIRAIAEYDQLDIFLEHVSLVMDNSSNQRDDKVTLMTVHAAKGLEFNTVFLAGWEEEIFPSAKALKENGLEGLEEERRLAYVGLTRAKKRAVITYALNRRLYGGVQMSLPSRFIEDLPKDHVSHVKSFSMFTRPSSTGAFNLAEGSPISSYVNHSSFKVNERVFHIKFGYGRITAIQGDKLDIHFDHTGPKKVVASFIEKA